MKASGLELRDVSFAMNGRKILDGVSWTIARGEHWAVLGPNGAGKTTLLKIVCGYLWPNAGGDVYRDGEAHADLGELRRSMGWVTSTLVDEIPKRERVLDTVLSGKYAQVGLWEFAWEPPVEKDFEKAARYLREMRCEDLAQRRFGTLSQGEQQKVLICRARMAKPHLIILDEPCAGMDPGARERFLASLMAIGKNPRHPSLVYVTHHVEEVLSIFAKTLVLLDGRVVASGATQDILTSETMQKLYGISVQLVKKDGRHWPLPA